MRIWLNEHWYLLVGVALVVVGALAVRALSVESPRTSRHSMLSYLLVWPLLIEKDGQRTSRRFFILGVLAMVVLVTLSILIHPESR